MPRLETFDYFLNAHAVDELLERYHLTHADVAHQLGYSRSYWSELVNNHRRLSPRIRRCLRQHPVFGTLDEAALWTRQMRGAS
jgi:plasmid maintenance system antidote protein VapI